jgi:hypothetical protein
MTIAEAIDLIDSRKPNHFAADDKIRWLNSLDGYVKNEIINAHEGYEDITFTGYDSETDATTELLIPSPYDEVYLFCLEKEIDYAMGEIAKYNNSSTAYNVALMNYRNYYRRTNMPLNSGGIKLFSDEVITWVSPLS